MMESIQVIESIKKKYPNFCIDETKPNSPTEEFLVEVNNNIVHIEDKYGPIKPTRK